MCDCVQLWMQSIGAFYCYGPCPAITWWYSPMLVTITSFFVEIPQAPLSLSHGPVCRYIRICSLLLLHLLLVSPLFFISLCLSLPSLVPDGNEEPICHLSRDPSRGSGRRWHEKSPLEVPPVCFACSWLLREAHGVRASGLRPRASLCLSLSGCWLQSMRRERTVMTA